MFTRSLVRLSHGSNPSVTLVTSLGNPAQQYPYILGFSGMVVGVAWYGWGKMLGAANDLKKAKAAQHHDSHGHH